MEGDLPKPDMIINLLLAECRSAWERVNVVTAENTELRKQVEALRPAEVRNERAQQQLIALGKQLIDEQRQSVTRLVDLQRVFQRALDETSCELSVALYKEFEKYPHQPKQFDHVLDAIEEMRMVLFKTKPPSLNHE